MACRRQSRDRRGEDLALLLQAAVSVPDDKLKPDSIERIRSLHEKRAAAELAAADALAPGSDSVRWSGSLVPQVALVKGNPGPAEASGDAALSGPDGTAAARALERLGYDPSQVFATLSRPEPGIDASARTARLRAQIEAVDAPLVIALDEVAAEDLAAAFGLDRLPFGVLESARGRRLMAIGGLEASLGDQALKQRVWRELSAARPLPPAF
jgi:hypothetical protein